MKAAVSVVVPLYNEEENVILLASQLIKLKKGADREYELLFVDDGSRDKSFQLLKDFKAQGNDIKIIRFKKNFGQTAALAAGIESSSGDIIVALDADLQNDPQDIPLVVAELEKGYDVISGWRKDRKDPFFSRKLPSGLANFLISWYTGVKLHDYGCTLKAYRKECLKGINLFGELHRFIPALVSWSGARIKEIPVRHHPRKFGKSKYGFARTINVILDLITVKFLLASSKGPMQIFGRIALWCGLFGFLSGVAALLMKFFDKTDLTGNPLLYLAVLFAIVSLQFISIGLLGEINVRIYNESQSKKIFVIEEVIS